MSETRKEIDPSEIERQLALCAAIREDNLRRSAAPLALVDTYGCQQNEADSELQRGFLTEMGYALTGDEFLAEVIVINSCAVREHAEMRVLGNVGALNHTKKARPGQIIVLCGCMVQQKHMPEKIKKSYPLVDIIFGPHELWRFPELLYRCVSGERRVVETSPPRGEIFEGLPRHRTNGAQAWLPVMYGCDNFCSYCVVPYVRGRERSRRFDTVLDEARGLIAAGARELTLLGQNVNSYGGGPDAEASFASLIRAVNDIDGEFLIRFMTSHPKDATETLFRAMAQSPKCARHLHLPAQSGSDRVLSAMNRGYTAAEYLDKIALARSLMPGLVITTDIIVGFPGETDGDFEDTLRLCEAARFDSMFTFIYSKRAGTAAADMPDPATRDEKQARFDRLIELQNTVSAQKHAEYVGRRERVLIVGAGRDGKGQEARTNGGRLVHISDTAGGKIGEFADALITKSGTWALHGEII